MHRTPMTATGFPSPAEDETSPALDLNRYLIKHPAATFFMRAAGNQMREHGITDGDIVVVDRSLTAHDGHIVVGQLNGQLMLRKLLRGPKGYQLITTQDDPPQPIREQDHFSVWGVVTFCLHSCSL